MKVLFIESRRKQEIEAELVIKEFLMSHKVKSIGLIASLQYLDLAKTFEGELKKKGINVFLSKGNKTSHESQILGCDVNAGLNISEKADVLIVLSDGRFHAFQLAISTDKPVFVLQNNKLAPIDKKDIETFNRKRKAAALNFLNVQSIGIIISTKPGQEKFNEAAKIKEIIERNNKKAFLFLCNTINLGDLENFSCKCWINTACPAIILDSNKIVNFAEIEKFLK